MLSFIFPWILVLVVASVVVAFLKRHILSSSSTAIILSLSIAPILIGQMIYLEYFFSVPAFTVICLIVFLIVAYRARTLYFSLAPLNQIFLSLQRINFKSAYYLGTIVIIYFFVAIRLITYPISWHDQLQYYRISSQMYATQSIDTKEIGIRPALPLMHNYFAKFSTNNVVQETQLQTLIFYYFTITLVALFALARKIASTNAAFFSVFLLVTCFNFVNFSILGYKEIIIISLSLCSLLLATEIYKLKQNSRDNYFLYLVQGAVLGYMSYIHMGGVILGLIILLAMAISNLNISIKYITKHLLIVISAYIFSFNELNIFVKWVLSGINNQLSFVGVANNVNLDLVSSHELAAFGIDNNLDRIIGKMQGFLHINSFGIVYWVALCLILVGFRRILKNWFARLILIISSLYLFFIIDPFKIFTHYSSYVFLVSPKYYLTILPIVILLASVDYEKLANYLSKLKKLWLVLIIIASTLIFLSQHQAINVLTKALGLVIPMHYRSMDYYTNKAWQILIVSAIASLAFAFMLLVFKKHTDKLNEIFITLLIFFIPFVFVLNNHFSLLQTVNNIASTRQVKATELLNKDNLYSEPASILLNQVDTWEYVYLNTEDAWTNGFILQQIGVLNDAYFRNDTDVSASLQCYSDTLCECDWILDKKDSTRHDYCVSSHKLEYENSSYILLSKFP